MLLLEARTLRRAARTATSDSKDPRTVNAEIRELIEMRNANVQRLSATHRKTGHRAMLPVCVNAIVFFHVRHDVIHEILSEFINGRPRAAKPGGPGWSG